MRENKIITDSFSFLNFIDLECIMELNQHGILKIKGMIEESKVEEYARLAEAEPWVCVKIKDENDIEKVFFHGYLTRWEINRESGCNILCIELYTGSYLLDVKSHTRSFQIEGNCYSNVIEQCLSGTECKYIIREKKDMQMEHFLVQYEETDWKFLLRIAGYMGTVIIPDIHNRGIKFYFGLDHMEKAEKITVEQYRIEVTFSGKKFIVSSRDIYNLGESVIFLGKKMIIEKVVTRMKGNELFHEYHLSTFPKEYIKYTYNCKIGGTSLRAKVTDTKDTRVKIVIEKDENKEKSGNKWFDYATVYSSPDGTGWYCMPEIGDEVRIVFPDEDESNAFVMSSIHLETANGRNNPDYKSWKNRQNKEILFTPEALIFRNNKGVSLELSDKEGVKIVSNKDIILRAGQDVQLVSENSEVSIKAESSINLEQGCAKIDMEKDINIYGGKIYMN